MVMMEVMLLLLLCDMRFTLMFNHDEPSRCHVAYRSGGGSCGTTHHHGACLVLLVGMQVDADGDADGVLRVVVLLVHGRQHGGQ